MEFYFFVIEGRLEEERLFVVNNLLYLGKISTHDVAQLALLPEQLVCSSQLLLHFSYFLLHQAGFLL